MISRIWKAIATASGARQYAEHFHGHVLQDLRAVPGYQGALLLQRPQDNRVEVVVISFWESEEAIRAFSGPHIDRAVVAQEARDVLESYDETVSHFDVIADDSIHQRE
jgi:heme-degrading monooxygenase HmoA